MRAGQHRGIDITKPHTGKANLMTDPIERYLAYWNETDLNTRRRLIDDLVPSA
jgi:hypothetical protein